MDNEFIFLEVERIKLLFEEEEYNEKDKINFIQAKLMKAKQENNKLDLEICNRLINEISK